MLVFIYKNDISGDVIINAWLLADVASLFSVVDNMNLSVTNLSSGLRKINTWANQWEMNVNPDPNKQAQEVVFPHEVKKTVCLPLNLKNNSVKQVLFQNHRGVYRDDNLQNMFKKVNKTIGSSRKLQNNLLRAPLATIYKAFIRPNLDYGEILND